MLNKSITLESSNPTVYIYIAASPEPTPGWHEADRAVDLDYTQKGPFVASDLSPTRDSGPEVNFRGRSIINV
jgi:hypothetical protein